MSERSSYDLCQQIKSYVDVGNLILQQLENHLTLKVLRDYITVHDCEWYCSWRYNEYNVNCIFGRAL